MIGCFPWIPNSFLHFCFISFACTSTVRSGFWGNSKVFTAQTSSTTALLETKFVLDDGVPRRSSLILNTFWKEFKVSSRMKFNIKTVPLQERRMPFQSCRWANTLKVEGHVEECVTSEFYPFSWPTPFICAYYISTSHSLRPMWIYDVQTLFCVCKDDIALHTTFPFPFS